jgi:hypothetical protein
MGLISGGLSIALLWFGIATWHLALWAVPLAWIVAWSARSLVTWLRYETGDWTTRRLGA